MEGAVYRISDVIASQVRVTLADQPRVRRPIESHANRPAQLAGRHRGHRAGEHGAILLAAEAAADLVDANGHLICLHAQDPRDLRLVAVGILGRAVNGDLPVRPGDRQRAVRLHVKVRLRAGLELAVQCRSSIWSVAWFREPLLIAPLTSDQDMPVVFGMRRESGGRVEQRVAGDRVLK